MVKQKEPSRYRILFSEKLIDLGNLSIASLAFSQFLTEKELSFLLLISGILLMVTCYFISYIISKRLWNH